MEKNCDKIDYQFLQASRYRHPRELILYEICRKEKIFLKNVFSVSFFVVFVVAVLIITYSMLCFTIKNQKLKDNTFFILALEYNRKSE